MNKSLALVLACSASLSAQRGALPLPEPAQQAQQLLRAGKFDEAANAWRRAAAEASGSAAVMSAAGVAFDIMGKSQDAQGYFQKAIDMAGNPLAKSAAQRAMANSFGFAGDCKNAANFEESAVSYWINTEEAADRFYQQGELYDEAARICIDSGDLDTAAKYYKLGHDAGLKQPNIPADRVKLWNYRYEHALARLAARRGDKAEAEKHVAAAKTLVESMEELKAAQMAFFPYLSGYVAFYTGDYKTALTDLLQTNQNDPFFQCLIGETYEKLGDKPKATEYFKKAAAATGHNPPAAYALRTARKKLAA